MNRPIVTALKKANVNRANTGQRRLLRKAAATGQIFIGGRVENTVIIVGDNNTLQLTPEALRKLALRNNVSLHQLPQPPRDFIGREKEFNRILAKSDKTKVVAISGLLGMGGIGKTSLGLIVAHYLETKYRDAQIFLDLGGGTPTPLKSDDVMKYVVRSLDPTKKLRRVTHSELAGFYQDVLSDKRVILFFDNVHDVSQVEDLLPPSKCRMIVTSRSQFEMDGLQWVKLDALNEKSAIQLLMKICLRIDRNDARRIAALCGFLPMALRLAARFLNIHIDWTLEEYIAHLADKNRRLEVLQPDKKSRSIQASFEQSYQQLTDYEQSHWRMLAVFPAPFKRDALMSVWGLDEKATLELTGKFLQYSILDYDENRARYHLHDLLAAFARTKLTEDDKSSASANFLRHYQSVWNTAEESYEKGGQGITQGLSLFDAEFTHIEAAYQWAKERVETDPEISAILRDFSQTHSLASLRLHPKKMMGWVETALIAARKNEDLYNQNILLGNIGAAYIDMGQYEQSIPYSEQALEIARNIVDEKHEAIWLGHIGVAYIDRGRSHEGIPYLEQALEIATRIGNLKHQTDCLNNLAVAYSNLGDTRKAIEYLKQSAKLAHKTKNTPRENEAKGNIGAGLVSLGENRKAIQYLNQATKISRKLKDRRLEGFWSGTLGMAYTNLGEYDQALACLNEALKIAREVGQRRDEHNWLGNIGVTYIAMGENRKAKKYLEQALKIVREIGDRQSEGDWMGNIGVIHVNLGEDRKGRKFLEQALAIALELDAKWQVAQWLDELGKFYIKIKNIRQAKDHLERALAISKELSISQIEADSLFNLAKLSQLEQNKESALKYVHQARAIFEMMESPELKKVDEFIESLKE